MSMYYSLCLLPVTAECKGLICCGLAIGVHSTYSIAICTCVQEMFPYLHELQHMKYLQRSHQIP